MAQIIKHRRGLIGGVKNLTARNGELIIASGSISDLSGPFVFIGSPNTVDEGVAGAFNSVSKLYTGTAAPTITAATYGSALDGTPYYASGNKSLYILNNSNVGNTQIDLTGNIEGNTISGVTINDLESTNVSASYFTGSFIGDGTGLYNVPASGVTGLELNQIGQGTVTASITEANGFNVNTDSAITGTLNVNGNTSITGTFVATDGAAFINQGVISQNSNLLLTSGSNLIIQDGGNINVSGSVYITGSQYVDNVISRTGNGFNALHLNGGTYGAPDVELTSANNISLLAEGGTPVVNVTGSLKVTGDATVEQNLYVSGNIYQTGSFFTQGDIVLSGSINIGDNISTDVINFNGEVSSSIVPKIHNVFDLGSEDKNWRNLHVSGIAYVDTLQARQVNFSDLGILQDLNVSGSTYLGNGNDILIVSGSIYNDQLTNNRVVIVGVDGVLEDDANFVFDGTILQVGQGLVEVDVADGDIRTSGSLNVVGSSELEGAVSINSTLDVTGSSTLKSTLEVKGATGLNSTLDVTGSATLKSTLEVKGATGLNSTLDVTGSAVLKDTLEVKGATGLNSTLNVTGSAVLKDTLEVKGATGLNSTLNVTGSATLKNTLEVQGAAGLNSTLDVTGSATLKSTLEVKGATGLNSSLDVTGSAVLKDTLEVKGATGLNSSLDVTGSAQFKSTINVDDEATLASATVEDLTSGRIVLAGAGGSLEDNADLAFDGSQLNVGQGNVTININGDIETLGTITAAGLVNNGDLTVNGILSVTGATGLQSTLDVTGSAVLKDTLEVKGATGLNSTLDVTGSVTFKDSLSVTGATTINGLTTINDDATVNGVLTVTGETQLQGNLYVSGNLEVLGSSTNVTIQSQTVDIGDNIIQVNAYSPFDRYAGLAAYDSGSSGASGSFLWDSTNDYWLLVNANSYTSKVIGTTVSTGGTGTEVSLTTGTFPIASASNTIGDSLLTFTGTTLAFNTNKFTVDSETGATAISGNLTLSYSGGTDNGTKTSAVTFRNSSNVLGFVSTTETTNELDGILGYNHSSGVLEFSSLIDGGTY